MSRRLTEDQVREIRISPLSSIALSQMFPVDASLIRCIRRDEIYQTVDLRGWTEGGRWARTYADLFWKRVDKSSDCWLWLGRRIKKGYGIAIFHGIRTTASRIAWILTNGPIPDGLEVLHTCDNPPCCRPDHLFLGTQADNMADMVRKGRSCKGDRSPMRKHPELRLRMTGDHSWMHLHADTRRGAGNPAAKLTASQVTAIRGLYRGSRVSQQALAVQYGIARTTVGRIVTGVAWREQ